MIVFRPHDDGEEILETHYSYLSVTGTFMYLTDFDRVDITFVYQTSLDGSKTYPQIC
jgi:hypothetical protein